MSYRNLIETEIVNELSNSFNITFLVEKDSSLKIQLEKIGFETIVFRKSLRTKILQKLFFPFEKIQYYAFYLKNKSPTMEKYVKRDLTSFSNLFYWYLAKVLLSFCKKDLFVHFYYRFFIPTYLQKKIVKYNSVFLLTTDDVLDKSILSFCNYKGVRAIVLVHSWDNLPARGFLSGVPDKLIVWNDFMKAQAISLHGIEPSSVVICGVPQFTYYKKLADQIDRTYFEQNYSIPKNKKVITYTCSAERVFPDEELFIEGLINLISHLGAVLVLRLHPTERKYYLQRFGGLPSVVIDHPSGKFAATNVKMLNFSADETLRFVSLMKFSDVVINLASTISLDAILFNTPVICPAFNVNEKVSLQWNAAKDWYHSTHYEWLKNTKSIRVAYSFQELECQLVAYLLDPEKDSKERFNAISYFHPIDSTAKLISEAFV